MALTKEWKLRIENWINALPRLFYKELGKILFEGFTTRELLTIDDIKDRAFKPMPEGTAWGAKWEYGWFRGNIILPESSENQMFVIKPDIGAESAVYINGEYAGAIDEYHRTVLLTKNAVPNDIYEIILEGYAGHGPRVCHAGPVEPGRETVPEPPETQAVVKKSTYGIWNEEVYQLYIDIKTLYEIRNSIDKDSLRVAEIDEALRKFTLTVDFELPFEEFMITVKKCRESLKPLLSCVNGSTVPEMFMFGHSHIDCAWLWPLAETSQARTKKGNRKCEFLLREAEIWGTLANTANGYPFGNMTLDQDWKTILTNQFHDILPGSSIKRVYEEAEADYKKVTENTGRIIKDAAETFADKNEAITVFNSLSWNSKKLVEVPFSTAFCRDEDGNILPVQSEPFGKFVEVDVPAMGYNTIYPCSETADIQNTVRATERSLENEYIRVIFNDNGEITSILDKESGRELAGDTCNVFKMYKDVPNLFDAWDIDSNYANMPVSLESRCDMEVIAQGPLFAALRIKKRLSNSDLEQEIILRKDSRQIDFRTKIDWQESHKLLKVCFPVSVHANEAIHEIQFGHIRRPNHYSTDFDQARFEVCHHKWVALCEGNHGVAILNDCKYGVNVLFNSINLTLLKSAMAPDMTADRGLHEFTYSLYIWEGSFADSEVVKKGYELNCPLITVYGSAGKASFLTIDKPNIVIETVKPAEDGSGDIIVRLYESMHMSVTCMLRASFPVSEAYQTNMLEKKQSVLEVSNNKTELRFRPFEIKTIRLVKG